MPLQCNCIYTKCYFFEYINGVMRYMGIARHRNGCVKIYNGVVIGNNGTVTAYSTIVLINNVEIINSCGGRS